MAAEVEWHDGERGRREPGRLRLLDQREAVAVRTAGRGAEGQIGLEPRVVLLNRVQRRDDPAARRRTGDLGVLDVDVDRLEFVRRDDLLIRRRQLARRTARLAELRARP